MTEKNHYIAPIAFLGLMFFSCGFALGINSILVPVLNTSLNVSSTGAYLLIAATFIPFLIFGYPAGKLIQIIGYKRTMATAFAMFALSFVIFIVSARAESFALFVAASFCCGTANAFLQTAINPYITILGPLESAAKRISMMGMINKLAWPVSPLFIAWVLGDIAHVRVADLDKPFNIIIAVFVLLGIVALLAPLPEVKAAGEDSADAQTPDAATSYADGKTSVFQFPHLVLGSIAIFFYVGAETIALGTMIDYAKSIGLANPEHYSWITPIAISIGYMAGIVLIPKYLSQTKALQICTVVAILGTLSVVLLPPHYSIFCVGVMALGCSLMWPAFWPLAMADLGRFTKAGSSVLTMGLIGGAIITILFGLLKDYYGAQHAYWICLVCFLYIAFYAFKGCKMR